MGVVEGKGRCLNQSTVSIERSKGGGSWMKDSLVAKQSTSQRHGFPQEKQWWTGSESHTILQSPSWPALLWIPDAQILRRGGSLSLSPPPLSPASASYQCFGVVSVQQTALICTLGLLPGAAGTEVNSQCNLGGDDSATGDSIDRGSKQECNRSRAPWPGLGTT